jgi:hypothetical protein
MLPTPPDVHAKILTGSLVPLRQQLRFFLCDNFFRSVTGQDRQTSSLTGGSRTGSASQNLCCIYVLANFATSEQVETGTMA